MIFTADHVFNASFDLFKANAGGSGRDALQSARQPEESATAGASATSALPGQYKQRTPMYNAGNTTNPATPTSPSTPVSTPANNGPPAATTANQQDTPSQPPTAPQTPTPAPAPTPPQPQPKKNLSLTVRGTLCFFLFVFFLLLIYNPSKSCWSAASRLTDVCTVCLLTERSNVRSPGDVQNGQQGHQTREGSHSGLHGWIQR